MLWLAPAANILAFVYTGSILGGALMLSRLVAALMMAFVVGAVMRAAFRKEANRQHPLPRAAVRAGPWIAQQHLSCWGWSWFRCWRPTTWCAREPSARRFSCGPC